MPNQPLEVKSGRHFTTQPVNSRVGHCGWAVELVLQLLHLVRATISFWIGATAAFSDERYNAPIVIFYS